MLVVKVELWPGGDADRARELCRMAIWNNGGDADHGDYGVVIPKSTSHGARSPGVWRAGTVRRFARRSARVGVWDLLRSALNNALGRRQTFAGTAELPDAAARIAKSIMQ